MPARLPPLPTSIVGSLPQPDWLIDRDRLAHQFPPRVRARELWRVAPDLLAEAQDDATRLAIRSQEEAGLDIVTDGEIRRESYSNHFATALTGVDVDDPGTVLNRSGKPIPVPRVRGEISRPTPIQADDVRCLRAHTDRTVKITVPGAFTMAQQAQDDHYRDGRALALAYADVVRAEIADTPVDTVAVETAQSHLDPATLRPLRGQGVALGVLDLSTPEVETPEVVADRVRRALDDVDVARLVLTSDCGLKYLPRVSAAGKTRSLALAADIVRAELT